jgi:hypothetical protein
MPTRPGASSASNVARAAHWLVLKSTWPCLKSPNSRFHYRSGPRHKYESCRSLIPLQLLQRPYMVFLNHFCTNCKQTLLFFGRQWIVPRGIDLHFSRISTPNFQCHSTWKLCPSTKYTTFTLGEFEVFRWNLENAAKVLGDIEGQRVFNWLGFWPRLTKVDQRGH